jgi:hypothetical protein
MTNEILSAAISFTMLNVLSDRFFNLRFSLSCLNIYIHPERALFEPVQGRDPGDILQ